MRSKSRLGLTFALVGAVAMWSCGGGGSTVGAGGATSTLTAPTAPSGGIRRTSEEEPAPTPTPDPSPAPAPTPDPVPAPPPAPAPLAVNIVGSSGNTAFMPNPIQASVGDTIVWNNSDKTLHHIVLEDGSDIGDVKPGESSAPMLLKSAAAKTYYCTIHSTMVGSINGELAPAPPPSATEPPPGDYYGGYSRRPRRTR